MKGTFPELIYSTKRKEWKGRDLEGQVAFFSIFIPNPPLLTASEKLNSLLNPQHNKLYASLGVATNKTVIVSVADICLIRAVNRYLFRSENPK